MNKLFLATALLFPVIIFAADEAIETTPSLNQFAINSRGVCEGFSVDIVLPETSKIVDSCDNYSTTKTGSRPEDVLNRRWASMLKSLSTKTNTVEKTPVLGRPRVGSGTLTRGGADRVVSLGEEQQPIRSTTEINYSTTKQFLLQDSRRLTKTQDEWLRRRNARSGITSGSATEMERSGDLSNEFWSTEAAQREQRLETQNSTEGIANYLSNRQYILKQGQKEKKEYVYKGPSLRRLYRGTRLEASVED